MTDRKRQDRIEELLKQCGIPYKKVHCYGHQVMVTAWSREAAERWSSVLGQFCRRVGHPVLSVDYNRENRGTVLRPTTHRVWRVGGTI